MNYLSTKELAEKWGVNQSRVLRLAREGRITGARLLGSRWMFPADAEKPADRRTRAVREKPKELPFRFPLYVNAEENAFTPPLSEEEKLLRRAQLLYSAYRLPEAEKLLLPLSENAGNRYVRIAALYYRCSIALYEARQDFDFLLNELYTSLSCDFPYRKEMLLFRFLVESDFCYYRSILEEFTVEPDYCYHPSAYPLLLVISFISLENGELPLLSHLRFETYELICQQLEHEGAFLEAQSLHYLLLAVFQLQNNMPKMLFHTSRGLQIALDKGFLLNAAAYQQYYPEITREALKAFPEEFGKKITACGKEIHEKLADFDCSLKLPNYLGLLSENEYKYAFLATQGYTNREIAEQLGVTEKYVSRKFGNIYEKLQVKNRQELAEMIIRFHKSGLGETEEPK